MIARIKKALIRWLKSSPHDRRKNVRFCTTELKEELFQKSRVSQQSQMFLEAKQYKINRVRLYLVTRRS